MKTMTTIRLHSTLQAVAAVGGMAAWGKAKVAGQGLQSDELLK
jgi:hypothetical protein